MIMIVIKVCLCCILGKLKWGVGKLIAHCPRKPIVIPFIHFGTENTYPQHSTTKVVRNTIPFSGEYELYII